MFGKMPLFVAGLLLAASTAGAADRAGLANGTADFLLTRGEAVLSQSAGMPAEVQIGDTLATGDRTVRVQTTTGHSLSLNPGTLATFTAPNQVRLTSGAVAVATRPGQPLTLLFQDVKFAASADERVVYAASALTEESISIDMLEGELLVAPDSTPQTLTVLDAGESVLVTRESGIWRVAALGTGQPGTETATEQEEEEEQEEAAAAPLEEGAAGGGSGTLVAGGIVAGVVIVGTGTYLIASNDDDDTEDEEGRPFRGFNPPFTCVITDQDYNPPEFAR